jgi:hypothetical protein
MEPQIFLNFLVVQDIYEWECMGIVVIFLNAKRKLLYCTTGFASQSGQVNHCRWQMFQAHRLHKAETVLINAAGKKEKDKCLP